MIEGTSLAATLPDYSMVVVSNGKKRPWTHAEVKNWFGAYSSWKPWETWKNTSKRK